MKTAALCIVILSLFVSSLFTQSAERKLNPDLVSLKPNVWVKIHQQKKGDKVFFMRQAHGGSCFDTKRCRLILFGSNTHSRDWTNSPLFFDPVSLTWTRAYPNDHKKTYAVNKKGIPVAGKNGDHPWATHTFGCVMYDRTRDEMVVTCYPGHMRPNKWGKAVRHLWPSIRRHPTWVFSCEQEQWKPLLCKPVHFFPNSAAFDTDRNVVIAHKPGRIYELAGDPRVWKRTAQGTTVPGWGHDNCVYDPVHRKLVIFGSNKNTNCIALYNPQTKTVERMKTPGVRPPKDQHNPMAFDPGSGMTVVLVDRTKKKDNAPKNRSETWCYDIEKDAWVQIQTAVLPFACGMNYNMEYDPFHKVLLQVTGGYGERTAV